MIFGAFPPSPLFASYMQMAASQRSVMPLKCCCLSSCWTDVCSLQRSVSAGHGWVPALHQLAPSLVTMCCIFDSVNATSVHSSYHDFFVARFSCSRPRQRSSRTTDPNFASCLIQRPCCAGKWRYQYFEFVWTILEVKLWSKYRKKREEKC